MSSSGGVAKAERGGEESGEDSEVDVWFVVIIDSFPSVPVDFLWVPVGGSIPVLDGDSALVKVQIEANVQVGGKKADGIVECDNEVEAECEKSYNYEFFEGK